MNRKESLRRKAREKKEPLCNRFEGRKGNVALAGSNKTTKTKHTLLLSYYESLQMIFIRVRPCSTRLMLPPPSFAHSLRPFSIHRFYTILSACFLGERRTKVDGLRLLVAHGEQHREEELSKTRTKGSRFDVINLRMAVRRGHDRDSSVIKMCRYRSGLRVPQFILHG